VTNLTPAQALFQYAFLVALLGLIPALIAKRKGESFLAFWVFGALLFIVALPWALVMRDKRRRCRHCAEPIQRAASVCPHCGRDQTT